MKKLLWTPVLAGMAIFSASGVVNAEEGMTKYKSYIETIENAIILEGQFTGGQLGSQIVSGDFNADGISDLAISAPFASTSLNEWNGAVTIYFGGQDGVVGVNFFGESSGALLGHGLGVFDFDGDGIDDLSMLAMTDWRGKIEQKIVVAHGQQQWTVKSYDMDIWQAEEVEELHLKTYGSQVYGDMNGDGSLEMVSLNSEGIPVIRDGSNEMLNEVIVNWDNALFGEDFLLIDFDNDGLKDLVLPAKSEDIIGGIDNGKIFILPGNSYPFGLKEEVIDQSDEEDEGDSNLNYATRAEFIRRILNEFNLRNEKEDFISSCYMYLDFCFFNFLAMSNFNGIKLEPELILYPDVRADYPYYEDIIIGSMLGLVNGYLDEAESPFYPEKSISRIQALKVVLTAAELVPPKYHFELVDVFGSLEALRGQKSYFEDVDARIDHMWWYPRYLNFAVENGIINDGKRFRPDEPITEEELNELINRTLEFIK